MKYSIRSAACVALLAVSAFCASSAAAQDPAKVAPGVYKVRLNNPRVRVLEVTGKAGQTAKMHAHPGYVVYNLGDGKVEFTDPKGVATKADMTAGEATWRDAERHASKVVTDIHALLFELKGRRGAARAAGGAAGADPVKADPDHYKVLLDNDRVRVLEFRSAPGDKTPMHSHPDYITYNFNDGRTKFSYPGGKPAVEVEAKAGGVIWHGAETHAGENIGGTEMRILIVELK
jgi:quercetin dioxygenase-like cupin family protein